MAILELILPSRTKTILRKDIEALNEIALRESERQRLSQRRAILWDAICNQSADIVSQLFVENSEKGLDWGLKRHRRKLSQPRLIAVYWWMLLYQLVLFKNRRPSGYHEEDEFDKLYQATHDFMELLIASPDFDAVNPGPWEERWHNQVSLEASLGLYNRMMELLGLQVDPDARIFRVSLFTSAAERAYDMNVKKVIEERNGSG